MLMLMALKKNDTIALVCTGSIADSDQEVRNTASYLLDKYQLNAVYEKDTFTALSAREKADIFLDHLFNDDVKAIWSLRGGEGTADVLPFIDQKRSEIAKLSPKLMLGFSDFTPLLVYFNQQFNWPTAHGAAARQLYLDLVNQKTESATIDLLFANKNELLIDDLMPLNQVAATSKRIAGQVIGGNLSLVDISIKDIWEVNPEGKILLLEEVNERPYRIARTLKYLQRIGLFDNAKAIVLAGCSFTQAAYAAKQTELANSMLRALKKFSESCQCPVFFTQQVSHGNDNLPVAFWRKGEISVEKGRLVFA